MSTLYDEFDLDLEHRLINWESLLDQDDIVNWESELTENLIAWFEPIPTFAGATIWHDLTGKHTGTLINGPTLKGGHPYHIGAMDYVSGSSQYVHSDSLAVHNDDFWWTFEVLFKPPDTTTSAGLIQYANTINWIGLHLRAHSDGKLRFTKSTAGFSENSILSSTASYKANLWNHAVAVQSNYSDRKIYLDGKHEGSNTDIASAAITSPVRMGYAFGTYSTVRIAGVRIYNKDLPADRIKRLYEESFSGYPTLLKWRPPSTVRMFAFPALSGGTSTGTAALTKASQTLAASASFTAPIYDAEAVLATGNADFVASAQYTSSTFTSTSSPNIGPAAFVGSGTVENLFTATAPLLSGNADFIATGSTESVSVGTIIVTLGNSCSNQDSGGANDASFIIDTSNWNAAATDTVIGKNSSGQVCGRWDRFTGAVIPQGATILRADLIIATKAGSGGSGTVSLRSACEAADNSTMPADYTDFNGRSYTSQVNWTTPSPSTVDTIQVDIAAAVQAVVNRVGWVSGNAISVMTRDNGSSTNINALSDFAISAILEIDFAIAFYDFTASATHNDPDYTSSVALTTGGQDFAATAQFANLFYTGTITVALSGSTLVASATHNDPDYTAVSSPNIGPVVFASTGTVENFFTSTAPLLSGNAEFVATSSHNDPDYTATSALTTGGQDFAAVMIFATVVYSSSAALITGGQDFVGSTVFTAPIYTGMIGVANTGATFLANAVHDDPQYIATVSLITGGQDFAASMIFAAAVFSSTAAVASTGATFTSSSSHNDPDYTASITVANTGAILAATSIFNLTVFTAYAPLVIGGAESASSIMWVDIPRTRRIQVNVPADRLVLGPLRSI